MLPLAEASAYGQEITMVFKTPKPKHLELAL